MNDFELKPYQEEAADKTFSHMRLATHEFEVAKSHSSISLSAPTGAGKTVIATSMIERIIFGTETEPPDPLATFVWLTDQPSLNQQTLEKMLSASEKLQVGHLITVDDSLNQPTLDPNKVYFLNIQKLGVKSNLMKKTDHRQWTMFDTLAATINERGGHYYLIIDEAHRGTGKQSSADQTLTQRLISDNLGALPPAPVVVGISATPQRFDDRMSAAASPPRTARKVPVDPADVRESGLLKDRLALEYKNEKQVMEATLLRSGVAELVEFDKAWTAYSKAEDEREVRPLIVIQVPAKTTDAQIAGWLDICAEEWKTLTGDAVAHTFESHMPREFGKHVVRYLAPERVEHDPDARLILFKEALTTGWDCPRAEVMVSFRNAEDYTYIAQLIGRMVRTPLARRIVSDETLNRVRLILPNFDEEAVKKIEKDLTSDPEGPGTEIEKNSIDAILNPKIDPALRDILAALTTYTPPARIHRSQVSRLHKMAARLSGDDILADAGKIADKYLVAALDTERARLDGDGTLATLIADAETAIAATREVDLRHGTAATSTSKTIVAHRDDIDRAYRMTSRQFKDGLHKTYFSYLVAEKTASRKAKTTIIALAGHTDVPTAVETAAETLISQWFKDHNAAIGLLSEDTQQAYRNIRQQSKTPQATNPALPKRITMSADDPAWDKHLYSTDKGVYHKAFTTTWEPDVLDMMLGNAATVGWYRNPERSSRSISMPYEINSTLKPMYPDFIIFETTDQGIRPSIIDPHGHHLGEAGPKLRGLGDYASKHGTDYARIVAVIKSAKDQFLGLDMKDETIRKALATVNTKDEIEDVFTTHGHTLTT